MVRKGPYPYYVTILGGGGGLTKYYGLSLKHGKVTGLVTEGGGVQKVA